MGVCLLMRIVNKHNTKNYLANRRIAVIQKSQRRNYTRIQFVNNRLVDQKILEWNNEINTNIYDPYTEENIRVQINQVNLPATTNELQRLLKHSMVTRNLESEVEATRVINNINHTLTGIEVERVIKNLDYIENILHNVDVDIVKYEALIEKLPPQTSRKEVLERCIKTDTELPSSKRQGWLERNLERGSSYNKKYTYKELNQLSRDLERYKTNRLDYETARLENIQADREGYDRVNVSKTWIWSGAEKTRHMELDGETIDFSEKFEVVNSQNGATDYLRFPNDVENDHNNCSNICNCLCSYEINQG